MKTHIIASQRFISICCFLLFVTLTSSGQTIHDLRSAENQADYVIVSPPQYKSVAEQLASFRSDHNSFSAVVVLTDSIYSQFSSTTTPDSAIREFITFAVTSWKTPSPKYFVLAGNVNTVPLHLEEGLQLPPEIIEDSIPVDWWFVEGEFKKSGTPQPLASIGRFPAFNIEQLQTMISKTITYQTQAEAAWMSRAIIVCDYDSTESSKIFEITGSYMANTMKMVWKDTILFHLRKDSYNYTSRENFLSAWNLGAGAINFIGLANEMYFSRYNYFATTDVASLTNDTKTPVCFYTSGSQRFEWEDSLTTIVNLMQTKDAGAVAVVAASGLMYFDSITEQMTNVFEEFTAVDTVALGSAVRNVKSGFASNVNGLRKINVIGDPALTIRRTLTLSVEPPKGTATAYSLEQNYPNPFNPSTTIRFSVPLESFVTLKVFNLVGQEVTTLVNEMKTAGAHHIQFNASGLSAGVYFYKIQAGEFSAVKKLVLLK